MTDDELNRTPGVETEERVFHTYLWSAFAARRTRETKVLDDRYRLYPPRVAVEELLKRSVSFCKPPQQADKATVEWWLATAGLWAATARISSLGEFEDDVRTAVSKRFGKEFASMRLGVVERPVIPDLFELGIEGVSVHTESYRATVRARVECFVARPYHLLRDIVCPSQWSMCVFWRDLPTEAPSDPSWDAGARTVRSKVWLPGGKYEKPDKARPVEMEVEIARSAFQSRIDYDGNDLGTGSRDEPDESENRYREKEIERFTGSHLVEKLEGRPGWCRVVLDRRASFCHINHDFMCKETLWYWLTSDLIGMVASIPRPAPSSQHPPADDDARAGSRGAAAKIDASPSIHAPPAATPARNRRRPTRLEPEPPIGGDDLTP